MLSRRALAASMLGIATLCAAVVSIAPLGAQQFVLSSQDRARLIAVDFVVVGVDRLPIADLRADEVTLQVDGRVRPVRALEYVSLASTAGVTAELLPYGSNVQTDGGRSVILIIDQYTIRPGREAALKSHVNTFLSGMGPRDRVALMTVPYGGLLVDLTTDHERVRRAISPLTGQAPPSESSDEASCRTTATLSALRGTLADLRGGEAPVAVVLFSSRLSPPAGVFAAPIPSPAMLTLPQCQLRTEQFKLVSGAAAAARAQFYVIQPELTVAPGGLDGLEHLTGVTGGPLLALGGGEDSALDRVIRETSGYYIARIEPEPSETDGTLSRMEIAVTRPRATVVQRPQLSIARPAPSRFVNAKGVTPLEMMKDVRPFRDLPLRVTGFASREPGQALVRVVAMFDSPDPSAALSTAMVGLFDDGGRLVASRQLSGTELAGSPVVSALSVPPGHYRLRVAAAEATGRGGSADYMVSAELPTAGPLAMSSLVLGLSRESRFAPRLEFGSEATVMAQVEIYGAAAGEAVGAVFEVARTVNGPALFTQPGTFGATSDADRFIVTAALPLGALAPGDYFVRATVAAQNKPGGRVIRALRKVIR